MSIPRRTGLKRTGRLNPMSARRRKVNAERRRAAESLDGEPCWLTTVVCTGQAEHWHELVGRAQGGSLVDPRNLVPACDRCNGWVEDHPETAAALGYKVRAFDAVPGERGLVPAVLSPYAVAYWRGGAA